MALLLTSIVDNELWQKCFWIFYSLSALVFTTFLPMWWHLKVRFRSILFLHLLFPYINFPLAVIARLRAHLWFFREDPSMRQSVTILPLASVQCGGGGRINSWHLQLRRILWRTSEDLSVDIALAEHCTVVVFRKLFCILRKSKRNHSEMKWLLSMGKLL